MHDEYNPNSLNAVISRIETRLEQGDAIMAGLTATMNRLNDTIGSLPCASHGEQIMQLLEVEKERKEGKTFWRRAWGKAMISIVSAAGGAVLLWLLSNIGGIVDSFKAGG